MKSVNKPVTALARETALILLEEGKHQLALNDTPGARSSFQEACGLDPENPEIWKCLASVSDGKDHDEFLARAIQIAPVKGPKKPFRLPISNRQLLLILGALGVLLVVGLLSLGAFSVWRSRQASVAAIPTAVPNPSTQISAEKGGKVFLNGEAGLWIPANSLPNTLNAKYMFQVVYAQEKDIHPFPESDLLKPVGRAVQVIAPDTILRQQAWFTLRYNPDELPANTDPASLQIARWDGSSWSISPREIDTDQKLIYVPIEHFSSPIFRLVAITAPAAPSTMAKQVDEANRLFFKNERDPRAQSAALYEKVVLSIKSTNELFALSPADRMNYWMAYNLWGDALFTSGQYAQAGVVYLSCVQTGLLGVLPVAWQDHIMTGPGYALQALQNRYPFGVSLTQELLAQPWAAGLPQDAFTLATQNYYWHQDRVDPWKDLPTYIQKTITTSENTQPDRPLYTPATSWSVLILSPQSQSETLLASTLNDTVTPFLQSTGIKNITPAMLKASAAQMRTQVEAMLKAAPTENSYVSDASVSQSDRQLRTPLLLLRVERAWIDTKGEITHTQYLFGLHTASSGAGEELIAQGDSFQLGSDGKLLATSRQYSWIKLDPDSTRNIQISINFGLYSLSAGKNHTCVITSTSQLECWGDNTNALLGTIEPVVEFEVKPKLVKELVNIVQVTAGDTHTCALEDSQNGGRVYCWGGNEFGQIGTGSYEIQKSPVLVNLTEKATFISAGARHTCAVGPSGQVYCWGSNASGQLGLDKAASPKVNLPTLVPGLTGVKEIASGYAHTCAMQADGRVSCWGSNSYGQLGSQGESTSTPRLVSGLTGVMSITSGESHACALTTQGAVSCWGYNGAGQVGSGSTESKIFAPAPVKGLQSGVTFISSYKNHTCAIQKSTVVCWGINTSGELGNGLQEDKQLTPVAVKGLPAGRWLSVTAGDGYTCSRDDTGFVYCWGKNESGQLGNQTLALSLSPQPVVGLGVLADTASQLEISPVKGTDLEMGVTVRVKASKVPAGAKTIVYRVKLASQDWVEIGREPASTSPKGIDYIASGALPKDKALFSAIFEMDQGQPTSPAPLELTVVDTREPSGEIQIIPPAQLIELGSTITFAAKNVSDARGEINGSGVKEVKFNVTENGVEMFTETIAIAENKPLEVTWPVPLNRKNNNTKVAFELVVTDNAGNEYKTPLADGFILSDRRAPTFLGNLLVKGDKLTDKAIEMGSAVSVTVSVSDVYDVNKQGSGIREVNFMASTNDKDYTVFDRYPVPDAATTREVTSAKSWSSVGQTLGQTVRFKAVVIDIAGNTSEQLSDLYHLDDTTKPIITIKTAPTGIINNGDPVTISAEITDKNGSGINSASITITCPDNGSPDKLPSTVMENMGNVQSGTISLTWTPSEGQCKWAKTSDVVFTVTAKDQKTNPAEPVPAISSYQFDNTDPSIASLTGLATIPSGSYTITAVADDKTASGLNGSGIDSFTLDKAVCSGTSVGSVSPVSNNGTTYTLTWNLSESDCTWGDNVTFKGSVKDKAGRLHPFTYPPPSGQVIFNVDTINPTVAITTSNSSPVASSEFTITANVNDGAKGSGVSDVRIQIACPGGGIGTGDSSTWPQMSPSNNVNQKGNGDYTYSWKINNATGCNLTNGEANATIKVVAKDKVPSPETHTGNSPQKDFTVEYDAPPTITNFAADPITGSPATATVHVLDIGSGVSTVKWTISCKDTSNHDVSFTHTLPGVPAPLYGDNIYTINWSFTGTPCAYNQDVEIQVSAYDNSQPLLNPEPPTEITVRFDYDAAAPVVSSLVIIQDGTQTVTDIHKPVTFSTVITDTNGSGVNPASVKLKIYCPVSTLITTLDLTAASSPTNTYTSALWPPASTSSCAYNQPVKVEVVAADIKSNEAVPFSDTPQYLYDYQGPTISITTPSGDVTGPVQVKATITDSESEVDTSTLTLKVYCPTNSPPLVATLTIPSLTNNSVFTFNSWPAPASDGACHYGDQVEFLVTAGDNNGNTNSASITKVYLYDITAPIVGTIDINPSGPIKTDVTISTDVADGAHGSGIKSVDLEIACDVSGSPASINRTMTLSTGNLYEYLWQTQTNDCDNNSDVTFTVTATDNAGNVDTATKSLKFQVNVPIQNPRYAWINWLRWPFSWLTPPSVSPLWKSAVGWW